MKYIKFLIMLCMCSVILSCGTQKFTVQGEPGMEIYSPDMNKLGSIDNSGTVDIKISSDDYYAFLLSKSNDSDLLIPFGLDYKTRKSFAGAPATITSALLLGGGTTALIAGAATGNVPVLCIGTVASIAIGLPMIGINYTCLNTLDYKYSFKYQPIQTTNHNFSFTYPNLQESDSVMSLQNTDTGVEQQVQSSKSTKSFGSKSTKSFKDYGAIIEGSYVGTGTLSLNGRTIENYKNIVVKILRKSNNTVSVQVVEDNGMEFFGSADSYTVKRDSNGTYSLTHVNIDVATIEIGSDKKMVYLHPRVNIDGDLYTLKINAQKK